MSILEVKKDWSGNSNSIYVTLGATNHSNKEREQNDFYATDPKAIDLLLKEENYSENIWECACGKGHLSERLIAKGYNVISTDLINRGYGRPNIDFLLQDEQFNGDIITNPPYKYATDFIYTALELVMEGNKVAMFLKIQFLEGKARKKLFMKYPPKIVYVSSSRLNCAMNGEFDKYPSSAVAYAWYVWEKGFTGETIIRWVN